MSNKRADSESSDKRAVTRCGNVESRLAASRPRNSGRRLNFFQAGKSLCLAATLMILAGPALAEPVLEKVRRTGVLNAGARAKGIVPFSFKDETGTFKGFSIDILSAIHVALEQHLGMPVKLDISEVDAETRFSRVQNGDLAIVCDTTTPTRQREEIVDFSATIFFDGVRILVDRSHSTGEISSLKSPRIGVIPNGTAIKTVQEKVPTAQIVPFPDLEDAFANLEAGKLDAIADNSVILRRIHRQAARPGRYSLLPFNDYLSIETFACIVPENDSRWRNFVDNSIIDLMKDIDKYSGRYYEIHRKWFRSGDGAQIPLNGEAITHFKSIIDIYGD